MKILMIAAENGAILGGKVGGIGDVIRDIPAALSELGQRVDIVTPGYQKFSRLPGAVRAGAIEVRFRGVIEHLEIYRLSAQGTEQADHWVVEHPLFAAGGAGVIYSDDSPDRPFAQDASKFALFCAAVAQACCESFWGALDVIHLHDWHAAFFALLARLSPTYLLLRESYLVYTIHNLSLQGIRPLEHDHSSLRAWFADLQEPWDLIVDPRYANCLNPTRAAINLCNRIHAVSPTYVQEIQAPSDPASGFVGGEGLEDDLRRAALAGRLVGILNGCDYPLEEKSNESELTSETLAAANKMPGADLLELIDINLQGWIAQQRLVESSHLLAFKRLWSWQQSALLDGDGLVVTFVGRLVAQKVNLLLQPLLEGDTPLDRILSSLQGRGVLLLLGSGDVQLERQMTAAMARHSNLLFLRGYSDQLSEQLYRCGKLFLMPSSFEPCGISQMLAMRAGQPCLVHHVGGLVDTVDNNHNGFAFDGITADQQALDLVERFNEVLSLYEENPSLWQQVAGRARNSRFLWRDAAKRYVEQLYN